MLEPLMLTVKRPRKVDRGIGASLGYREGRQKRQPWETEEADEKENRAAGEGRRQRKVFSKFLACGNSFSPPACRSCQTTSGRSTRATSLLEFVDRHAWDSQLTGRRKLSDFVSTRFHFSYANGASLKSNHPGKEKIREAKE